MEQAWRYAVDSLEKMTREAQKRGVTLAFEILLPNESNLVNDLASTCRMMKEIDDPHLMCCIDTVPVCREGKTLEDYFAALGQRIVHIHLNDGTPTGHLTWGDGNQPLPGAFGHVGAVGLCRRHHAGAGGRAVLPTARGTPGAGAPGAGNGLWAEARPASIRKSIERGVSDGIASLADFYWQLCASAVQL